MSDTINTISFYKTPLGPSRSYTHFLRVPIELHVPTRSCRRRCHHLNYVPTALVAVFVQLEYGTPDQRSLLLPNRDTLDRHCRASQTRESLRRASDSLVIAVTFDVDRNAVDTASPTQTPPLPTPAPTTPSPTSNQTQQKLAMFTPLEAFILRIGQT